MTTEAKHRDRHRPTPAVLGVALVAILCAGTAAVVVHGLDSAPKAPRPTFESLTPSSAASIMSLDADEASWKLVTAVDAPLALGILDYSKLPAAPATLGASISPESGTTGRTEVYLDFTSAKAAKSTISWLDRQAGADQRLTAQKGKTVLVTDPSKAGLAATNSFPRRAATESSRALADLAARHLGDNRLWLDFNQVDKAIAGPADKTRLSILAKFQTEAVGIKANTRWVGSAGNVSGAWTGEFTAGGYDTTTLAPTSAVALLMGTQTATSATSEQKSTGESGIVDAGMSPLLGTTSVKYHVGKSSVDDETIPGVAVDAWPKYLPAKPEVAASIPVGTWIATASGLAEEGQGIRTLAIALSKGKMTLGLIQNPNRYKLAKGIEGTPSDSATSTPVDPTTLVPAPTPRPWMPGDDNPVTDEKSGSSKASKTPGTIVDPDPYVAPSAPAEGPVVPSKTVAPAPSDLDEPGVTVTPFPKGFGSGG